ncbi:response regulator transcription factor [uncultured Tenacibaculum sp.]|uniref:LytR/AlgR family response regulator transcription factor n=1 Tax=uncultured Tenacibaculum sp. TaxID=174713 RepID=UPI002632489D|nr:response regulator transcription factor [uncultured Tenacibaculum sp.]
MRYIIIDDEPLAHQLIEGFCSMLPHLSLQKNCYNAIEAMQFLNSNTVDFMFLDLNMPKLKGFDFLRTLQNPPKVIVTTAYKEHALEGFELNVVDYLLKPFSFERMLTAINKVLSTTSESATPVAATNTTQTSSNFFVKGDKKYHQVATENIVCVEAYGNYCKLHLKDDTVIISHEKISHFESFLAPHNFIRVHKSYIISIPKITVIEGNRIFIGDKTIPIGQTYKQEVVKFIK